MPLTTPTTEKQCPFTSQPIEEAYGEEVSMFLHCHLRGYDRDGDGKQQNYDYYDKYGAPVLKDNSWEEGYHVAEKTLAKHYNNVVNKDLKFPLVAGMGGGVHLYKSKHNEKPWNWTGWVPEQTRFLSQRVFFSNRYFLTLRGNEIQNNLWDYDPHEEEGGDTEDLEYSQLDPNDRYRGGYWFYCQSFGRYLHIISLKSHEKDPVTSISPRYNYIVHPLVYRSAIDVLPDNSVDAMQWTIINMPDEKHFGAGEPWGEKCHGLEIFNDFTYFYSWQPLEPNGPNNGQLCTDKKPIHGDNVYYFWFDTYPLEFAVFLLDSALARGVYFHTMCANDAFYDRYIAPNEEHSPDVLADPKCNIVTKKTPSSDPRLGVFKIDEPKDTEKEKKSANISESVKFLKTRPYGVDTAFGYVTLLDPQTKIKHAVFDEYKGIPHMGLKEGEKLAMAFLRNGDYYSTTGLYDLFEYEYTSPPIEIFKQHQIHPLKETESLCYDLTDKMGMKFTFLRCTTDTADLIWRFTIMITTRNNELQTAHGYFKLDPNKQTILDLTKTYDDLTAVKWLYFTAISPTNPQKRAWFHAIRGPAFGKPVFNAKLPELEHIVFETKTERNTVTAIKKINPTPVPSGNLDFALKRPEPGSSKKFLYVYFMQVCPRQQDFSRNDNAKIKESSELIPPRILQSVHGYFPRPDDHRTRINMSASWDKTTVKDNIVYFYRIEVSNGKPSHMETGDEPHGDQMTG